MWTTHGGLPIMLLLVVYDPSNNIKYTIFSNKGQSILRSFVNSTKNQNERRIRIYSPMTYNLIYGMKVSPLK